MKVGQQLKKLAPRLFVCVWHSKGQRLLKRAETKRVQMLAVSVTRSGVAFTEQTSNKQITLLLLQIKIDIHHEPITTWLLPQVVHSLKQIVLYWQTEWEYNLMIREAERDKKAKKDKKKKKRIEIPRFNNYHHYCRQSARRKFAQHLYDYPLCVTAHMLVYQTIFMYIKFHT